MTVRELIEKLQEFDPDLPVCYELHSEQLMMEPDQLKVQQLQPARADGWVPDARYGEPTVSYLVFPGN
jgi:hypothetical protein